MPNCRVVKNEEPWHKFTAKDGFGGKFVLVGPGKRTYLGVHTNDPLQKGLGYLMGPKTLRRLAYAILRSVPATKRERRIDMPYQGGAND